jgi:hypothetical protein
VEVGTFTQRNLDRNHLRREASFDLLVNPIEVGVLLVHHRHDEQHGIAPLHRLAEHALCPHFDAAVRADDAQCAIGCRQSRY